MTDSTAPEVARTFRATSGVVSFVLCALLAVFLLGDAALRAGWAQMMLLAPWVLLSLWVVYEVAFVSHVRVDEHGVTVQNLLRRTTVGWRRVSDIDLRWQLVFTLDDGTDLTSWGGPTRSRPPRRPTGEEEAPKAPPGIRDLTDIRERWQAAPEVADAQIQRGWDGPAILVFAVIAVWAVAVLIIAGG